MATNETTPVKKVPSYMRGTATSSNRVTPEKKKLPTQPLRTSYQPRMSVPKSPARKMAKGSDVISKPLYTPSPSSSSSFSSSNKRTTSQTGASRKGGSVKPVLTKWERLMEKVPKDCLVYPSPKKDKPTTREELISLEQKGYYKMDDSVQDDQWHIITVILNYRMDELNEKWEVECPDGLFWVTFREKDIEPGTKFGKYLVRAKICKSDKWLHAYLIHKHPLVGRDMKLTVTDEVVWAIGEYDFWDELPEW